MLTTKKSTTLNGSSKIVTEDGMEVIAVSMTASIPEVGNATSNATIINQEVYDANKAECRADMDAFTVAVREIEDAE